MKITIKRVPVAFPAVFKPEGTYQRYGFSAPIEPNGENAKLIEKAMQSVAKEKWGDKAAGVYKKAVADGNVCFLKAEKTNAEGETYAGFQDMWTFNASGTKRVIAKDRNGKTDLAESDDKIYGGAICNLVVEIWAQDNKWGKRINANPIGIQFVEDGERFGGGGSVAEDSDFEELESDEGEFDMDDIA